MSKNKSIEEIKEGIVRMQDHKIILETTSDNVRKAVARTYQPELMKHYYIDELTQKSDGSFIVKFEKRYEPLTEEDYQQGYWPHVESIIWKK